METYSIVIDGIEFVPKLIPEEPKEVFTWDDTDWHGIIYNIKKKDHPVDWLIRQLNIVLQSKQSKASTTVNLTLNDSHRVTNTSKERILVNATSCGDSGKEIFVFTSQKYNLNKLTEIKQAIEDTLNGIPTPSFINYSLDHKFTQQDLDKAREQTWEACRETTDQPIGRGEYNDGDCGDLYRNKYPTLESYLQTINK